MVERDFDKLGNIQSALRTLRQYNQYVLFPVDESVFENPALEEYFNSPLDAPIERNIEKIVCVAGIKAVYDNPNIPAQNKQQSARNTARDLRQAMRIAKIEYHAAEKDLTHKEYNRRKRAIPIVDRRMKVQMAKTIVKNASISTIATVVAGPIGGAATLASRLVWRLLPRSIKEPVQKEAEKIKEKAFTVIENTYECIKTTSVGKKIEEVKQKAKPIIDNLKRIGKKCIDKLKSYWPF